MTDWQEKVENELAQAQLARQRGNEGMARVCARRAAGFAIQEYFRQARRESPGSIAYDQLRALQSLTGLPDPARRAAELLTLRVNESFSLPVEADLIAEARILVDALFPPAQDNNTIPQNDR